MSLDHNWVDRSQFGVGLVDPVLSGGGVSATELSPSFSQHRQMLSSLPDKGAKIQDHQLRLQARLQELEAVAKIGKGLDDTHLDPKAHNSAWIKQQHGTTDDMELTDLASSTTASHMSTGVIEYGDGPANSPTTKRKLLDKIHVSQPPPTQINTCAM